MRTLPNDLEHLDPGIADVVRRLRAAGLNTTDSGDGVSKFPGGHWERLGYDLTDYCAIPFPHVAVTAVTDEMDHAVDVIERVTGWTEITASRHNGQWVILACGDAVAP